MNKCFRNIFDYVLWLSFCQYLKTHLKFHEPLYTRPCKEGHWPTEMTAFNFDAPAYAPLCQGLWRHKPIILIDSWGHEPRLVAIGLPKRLQAGLEWSIRWRKQVLTHRYSIVPNCKIRYWSLTRFRDRPIRNGIRRPSREGKQAHLCDARNQQSLLGRCRRDRRKENVLTWGDPDESKLRQGVSRGHSSCRKRALKDREVSQSSEGLNPQSSWGQAVLWNENSYRNLLIAYT